MRECVEQLRPVHDFLRTGVARHDKQSTGSLFFDRILDRHPPAKDLANGALPVNEPRPATRAKAGAEQ